MYNSFVGSGQDSVEVGGKRYSTEGGVGFAPKRAKTAVEGGGVISSMKVMPSNVLKIRYRRTKCEYTHKQLHFEYCYIKFLL